MTSRAAGCSREVHAADITSGSGELSRRVSFHGQQLRGALVDVTGECLRLRLTSGLLCDGSTGVSVNDGQVLTNLKAFVLGVFDGVQGSSLRRADVACPSACNLGRVPQEIGLSAYRS
ncbi:hypothetical protein [Mycobacterium simiae]|uniref:hypothetical protein n=1 Tax=Mycobacterium simiae TaxID=1784 RepID=UPI0004287A8A|nr:hypothetical protein X011_17835 [Mycobacterium tuberculosis variant microti OV254]